MTGEAQPRANDAGSPSSLPSSLPSRSWFGPLAVVVASLAVAALATSFGGAASGDGLAALTPAPKEPETTAPLRPAQLVAFGHLDASGSIDMLALAGADRGAATSTIVLVPTSTLVEIPSLERRPVADLGFAAEATDADRNQLVRTNLENALGVTLSNVVLLNDAELRFVFAPTDQWNVTFPDPVEVDDAQGNLSIPAGTHSLPMDRVVRLFGATETPEIEHLVTVQALFEAWRDEMSSDPEAKVAAADMAFLADTDVRFQSLPVEPLAAGAAERYQLQRGPTEELMHDAFAWALIDGGNVRPRVELRNGTGEVGITQEAADKIVPAGGEVVLTGNEPGFGVSQTRVVYYNDESRAAAQKLLAALGVGTIARSDQNVSVVDVTIVIGSDWPGSTAQT